LAALPALAQDELTIYPVKYRSAEELIKVAEPVFFGRATFSSLNEKIVISAPEKTAQAVLKLFAELDRKPRTFEISVRLRARGERSNSGVGIRRQGVRIESNSSAGSENSLQSVKVLEQKEARLLEGSTYFPGGFIAKARSAGKNKVTLEIRQRQGSANPAIALSSEVTAALGEWQTIGSARQDRTNSLSEILGSSSGASSEAKDIQVKVDLVR